MKKIYHKFFNISKCEKVSDKVFKTRIIFSAFVMLICCMAFCSATFAWFTSTKKVDISPITAASYSMDIYLGETKIGTSSYDQKLNKIQPVSYSCPLATEDKHTFTLRAGGSSKKGYCVITIKGQIYGIVPTNGDASYTITIQAAEGTEITFSANWGVYEGNDTIYEDNSTIVVSTTSQENQASTYSNTEATTQPAEGNASSDTGEDTSPANTPPVNTEAPATGTGEQENSGTPEPPSESETSGDDTTTSTSTETTGQESEGDVEVQAQQNLATEAIVETE